MAMVQLNMDVIGEILSRLRVKDAIRFKSVCKSWLHLISSEEFIQLHLKRCRFRAICLEMSYFMDCACLQNVKLGGRLSIVLGSSCDGLVCLFNRFAGVIHLWNPAIRSCACIPMKNRPPLKFQLFWFGLHDGDYKLLLGTSDLKMHLVNPYIDSGYDWKSTQKPKANYIPEDYQDFDYVIGTLFNGNVHWPVIRKYDVSSTILSYDLHHGTKGTVAIPVYMLGGRDESVIVRLGEVDRCLSALVSHLKWGSKLSAFVSVLWAMKEYGVEESWTKLVVFDTESALALPVRSLTLEEEVLEDPATIKSPIYRKSIYVESLVSPRLGTKMSLKNHTIKSCHANEKDI